MNNDKNITLRLTKTELSNLITGMNTFYRYGGEIEHSLTLKLADAKKKSQRS